MSLRTAMLRVGNVVRTIASKPGLDVWPTTVKVRTRTWTAGRRGREGGFTDVDVLITPTPMARWVTSREIRASAGRYTVGDVIVEHITPAHAANPGIGYTQDQLQPVAPANGVETIYVLEGEIAGDFSLVSLDVIDVVTYNLHLRRMRTTP